MNTSPRKSRPAPAHAETERKEAEASEGDLVKLRAVCSKLMRNLADSHERAAVELREAAK